MEKIVMLPTMKCKLCNRPFLLTKKHKRFCCEDHKNKWHRAHDERANHHCKPKEYDLLMAIKYAFIGIEEAARDCVALIESRLKSEI